MKPSDKERIERKIKRLNSYKQPLIIAKKPVDLAQLILRLIFQNCRTFYAKDDLTIKSQQKSGNSRSAEDIYRICRSYDKKSNYTKVENALIHLDKHGIISRDYCTVVLKMVHSPHNLSTSEETIRKVLGDKNIKFN